MSHETKYIIIKYLLKDIFCVSVEVVGSLSIGHSHSSLSLSSGKKGHLTHSAILSSMKQRFVYFFRIYFPVKRYP